MRRVAAAWWAEAIRKLYPESVEKPLEDPEAELNDPK